MNLSATNPYLKQMAFRAIGWLLLIFVMLILGIACAILPPLYILLFGSMLLSLVFAVIFPSAAFFVFLLLVFGLLPSFLMSSLPLGGATIRPPEMILGFLLIVLSLKNIDRIQQIMSPAKVIAWPLYLLVMGLLVGFVVGKFLYHNELALAEFRQYFGWLALPVALFLADSKPGILHKMVIGISIVASLLMIFQLLTGIQVIYGFRGAEELSKSFVDIKRSAIGGGVLFQVYSAFWLFGHSCEGDRYRNWSLLGLSIIIGGIVAGFSRGVWAGLVVGGLVFLMMSPDIKKKKSSRLLFLGILLVSAGLVVAAAFPRIGESVVDRVTGIDKEGGRGTSVGFRLNEASQAWEKIKAHPITGLGLGAEYKRTFRQGTADGFNIEASFIHNAYLALWIKLGLAGVLFPFALLIYLTVNLRKGMKVMLVVSKLSEPMGSLLEQTAVFSTLVMMLVYSVSSPEWSQQGDIAAFATLLAIYLRSLRGELHPTMTSKKKSNSDSACGEEATFLH